jgi:hypothetical protein
MRSPNGYPRHASFFLASLGAGVAPRAAVSHLERSPQECYYQNEKVVCVPILFTHVMYRVACRGFDTPRL